MSTDVGRVILSGMRVLIEDDWVSDQAVVIEHNRIQAIIPLSMIEHHLPATQHAFPQDHYLAPGFIDLHVHGAAGTDVMDATPSAITTMSEALAKEGVTGFLATTMTASADHIHRALKSVSIASTQCLGARLLGVHLEGPFIAKDKMGAQQDKYIIPPDISLLKAWQTESGGLIKLITIAPELSNAIEFIHTLTHMGVVVSLGHTNATYDIAKEAIAAGASYATHLFNAMKSLHHREPGVVGATLLSSSVTTELIADGLHVHPAILALVYQLKDKNHIVLVTDAMRAKCMKDGVYEFGGQMVTVEHQKATLSDGTIAGSVLTMNQAIAYFCQSVGISLADAICMASTTPARVLGMSDRKGSIDVGKDADLVVLNAEYKAVLTMVEGNIAYIAESTRGL